jgi:hypothetical protein
MDVALTCDNEASPRGGGTPPEALTHLLDRGERGLAVKATQTCSVMGCERAHLARGYCNAHYQRYKKYGDPKADQALLRKPVPGAPEPIDLFRDFLRESESGCWEWTGTMTPQGYGRFNINGNAHYTHRWAYETLVRPIPEGLVLDHLCRNRRCCNPAHLDVVTHQTNLARGMSPSAVVVRTNVCKRGHDLTEDNVYWQRGTRVCRACTRERQIARRAERRA